MCAWQLLAHMPDTGAVAFSAVLAVCSVFCVWKTACTAGVFSPKKAHFPSCNLSCIDCTLFLYRWVTVSRSAECV